MAWLEVHQSLLTHRKTLELADLLGLPPLYAASHVIALWLWALDNAPGGDLHVRVTILSRAAQWSGDANSFVNALIESGFLDQGDDGNITIHDWDDYAGKLIDARRKHAETVRNSRRAKRETPPDESDPHVTVTLPSRDRLQYSTVPSVNYYKEDDDAHAQKNAQPRQQPGTANMPPEIRAEIALRKYLLDKAATLMTKQRLLKAQENSLSAWFVQHKGDLTPELIDLGVGQAADYTGGDSLAYMKTVIENKINGVEKPKGGTSNGVGAHTERKLQPTRRQQAIRDGFKDAFGVSLDEAFGGGRGGTAANNPAGDVRLLPGGRQAG